MSFLLEKKDSCVLNCWGCWPCPVLYLLIPCKFANPSKPSPLNLQTFLSHLPFLLATILIALLFPRLVSEFWIPHLLPSFFCFSISIYMKHIFFVLFAHLRKYFLGDEWIRIILAMNASFLYWLNSHTLSILLDSS